MMVDVICLNCRATVKKRKDHVVKYARSFCSRRCFADYKLAIHVDCSVEGCSNRKLAKGMCGKCYDKSRKDYPARVESRIKYSKKLSERKRLDPEFRAQHNKANLPSSRKYRELNREHLKKCDLIKWDSIPRRYKRSKTLAADRGLEFTLTQEQYKKLATKGTPCHYECGNVVAKTGIGLDRIDNDKGYSIDNVVSCCGFCNILKGSLLSYEECKALILQLKKTRNKSNIWEGAEYGREISKKRKQLMDTRKIDIVT